MMIITCIIPTIAFWGSPDGSKTSANSAMGAVPSNYWEWHEKKNANLWVLIINCSII
jgi:hypothetical protein